MNKNIACLALLAGALAEPCLAQSAPKLTFSTGIDYSRGDFDADAKTSVIYAPFTTQLSWADWSFGATIPYIRIEGPGAVVGGGDTGVVVTCGPRRQRLGLCPADAPAAAQAPVTRSGGLGDVSFSAGYLLPEAWTGSWLVELQARLKAPTASTQDGLGTGKVDYGFGVDIARAHGLVRPFVNLGYRVLGDFTYVNPATGETQAVDFRNGPAISTGTSLVFGDNTVLLSYDYARKTVDTAADSHSLYGGWSYHVNDRLDLTGYGAAGLSRSAPDFAVGVQLSVPIGL